ncbi:MAG: DUF2797 domain-containing protein [Porticoccaceae bacterium]
MAALTMTAHIAAATHSGPLDKMTVELAEQVQYALPLGDERIPLNPLLGHTLKLVYRGDIRCVHCGRASKKSFSQGYCYPCFKTLAQCDTCILSPERCHFHLGTCREPEWAQGFCMSEHIVYLANASGAKAGITRANQLPTRWIDQGAVQALPILRASTRQQAGFVEHLLREHVSDRTNWRAMLKGDPEPIDLPALRDELLARCSTAFAELQQRFGIQALQPLDAAVCIDIRYPVIAYPAKVASHDLDKNPVIEGTLLGIKGQYLLFDTGVFNVRKYTAYRVDAVL